MPTLQQMFHDVQRMHSAALPPPAVPEVPTVRSAADAGDYARHRERMAAVSRAKSKSGRDIGPLPPVQDPERKERCRKSFRAFCEAYFPLRFPLAWSEPHLRAINRMETCVMHGGLFALALARASGKTTLAECAALWGVLYGYRRFVLIVAAT